jgi:hypothetical protein
MKFKLSRQVIDKEILKIISREMRRQNMTVAKATRQELRQLAQISKIIERVGLPDYLVCRPLGRGLGHGIFLHPDASPIEKGSVIGSYSGAVSLIAQNGPDDGSYAFMPVEDMHLSREEQQLYDASKCYRPKRLYAFKVDGAKAGNFTRYINHSEKPNVIAYSLAVPNNPYGLVPSPVEIIYFAKKTIYPGEQLLVSYEDGGEKCYWGGAKPFSMTPKTFRLKNNKLHFHRL